MKKPLFFVFLFPLGFLFSQENKEGIHMDVSSNENVHIMSKAEETTHWNSEQDKSTSCALATTSPPVILQTAYNLGDPSLYTNGTNVNFTNSMSTAPTIAESCTGVAGFNTAGTWIRVNPDPGVQTLDFLFSSGSFASGNHSVFIQFFQGNSCASLTGIGCQQMAQIIMGTFGQFQVHQEGINDAQDVWMYVWDDGGKAINMNYEVIGSGVVPLNANCSTALPYTCNSSPLQSNLGAGPEPLWTGPSNNGKMCSGGTWYSNENTMYYPFTAESATISVSLYGISCNDGTSGQLQMGVWKGCSCIGNYTAGCFIGCAVGNTLNVSGLIPGDTYVLVIDGQASNLCKWSFSTGGIILGSPDVQGTMSQSPEPACENEAVNLSIDTGPNPTCNFDFLWQVNTGSGWSTVTDGGFYSGSSTSVLTINPAPLSFDNYQYRCFYTSSHRSFSYYSEDNVTTQVLTLEISPPGAIPSINADPLNQSSCENGNATFGITASNANAYQWQQNSGSGFSNLAGQTEDTLSLSAVTSAMNGYSYRCIAYSCSSSDTSALSVLSVNAIATISSTSPGYRINTSGSVSLGATGSAGSTLNWYTSSTGGTSLATGNSFNTPGLSATTSYYVDATNTCGTSARTAVVASIYETKLDVGSCGITMVNYSVPLTAIAVPGATNYRFKIQNTNLAYLANSYSTIPQMPSNWVTNLQNNQTYTIRVAVMKDGVWSAFGPICNVTTPTILLKPAYCNSTLSTLNQPVYCNKIAVATNYRYLIENTGLAYSGTFTRGSADTLFKLSALNGIQYATTYSVRVAFYYGGNWSPYGPACNLTTPSEPKLINSDCGITLSLMSQDIHAIVDIGATNYRFLIENTGLGFSKTVTTGSSLSTFKMSTISGITTNTAYSVKVAYYKAGIWSAYGSACTVTSAANPAIYHSGGNISEANGTDPITVGLLEEIYLEAFPNPNHGEFTISSSHEGEFTVSNELGQVLKKISLNRDNAYKTEIKGLKNGVYIISGFIDNEVIYRKVLVN